MRFLAGFVVLLCFCSGAQANSSLVRGVLGADFGIAAGTYDWGAPLVGEEEQVNGVSLVYGFKGGVRIGDYLGIDVGMTDLGTFEGSTLGGESRISTDMKTVSLLGMIPAGEDMSVLFRIGQARWEITEKFERFFSEKSDDSGTDLFFGVGIEAALAENFVLGAELQVFQMEPVLFSFESDVTYVTTSASLMYRF